MSGSILTLLPNFKEISCDWNGVCAGLPEVANMTYLASSGLCIGAIACLANQSTARLGNSLGIIGVTGGIGATLGLINGDPALYAQILGILALTSAASCQQQIDANAKLPSDR